MDTVSPLTRQMKSSSFSIQENGEIERMTPLRRRPSVLDEKALREADTQTTRDQRIHAITRNYQGILESIGEDPTRQGLRLPLVRIFHWIFLFVSRASQDIETCS